MKTIGVGIIGASPLNPGWAVLAHIPALKALPDYELRAISTNRRDSAEAAAKAFGVAATFDNHIDLIADPGVDLESLALDVAQFSIQITVVEPGFSRTDFLDSSSANYGSKVIDDYVRVTPLGEGTLLNYGKYFSAAMR